MCFPRDVVHISFFAVLHVSLMAITSQLTSAISCKSVSISSSVVRLLAFLCMSVNWVLAGVGGWTSLVGHGRLELDGCACVVRFGGGTFEVGAGVKDVIICPRFVVEADHSEDH